MADCDDAENVKFKWGKKKGIGGKNKDVQFYESFTFDDVEYSLYDCVYLYKDGESEPYIGKLIKIWELADKSKKVKLLWFFQACEISPYLKEVEGILENELFLASGEGQGLANINYLEAIAGKCNVVCVSKDKRNPQPSDEELRMAEFVFYRTFDVGLCNVKDTIDEKIAGIEAKYIFNIPGSKKSSGIFEVEAAEKDVEKPLESMPSDEKGEENKYSKQLAIGKSSLQAKGSSDNHEELTKVSAANNFIEGLCNTPDHEELTKVSAANNFIEGLCNTPDSHKSSDILRVEASNKDVEKPLENVRRDENGDNSKHSKQLVKQKSSLGETILLDTQGGFPKATSTNNKTEGLCDVRSVQRSEGNHNKRERDYVNDKSMQKNGELDVMPTKKPRINGSLSGTNENRTQLEKLSIGCERDDSMAIATIVSPRDKSKNPLGRGKGPIENQTFDAKLAKPMDGKLPKLSHKPSSNDDLEVKGQVLEVTRRPDEDRSTWFKAFSWEDRMQRAHEQGTLVLLQNLDPSYTSADVEDIVWHGFKEPCTAQMIQRTALSSRYVGQALVAFKTRDAAEKVVRKLDTGCLLLNERPLVGSIAEPCFPEKKPIFYGHLVLDKLRHKQREMKEAVSTSHCSQPNTIEYDMAMDWCLLQDRFDHTLKNLSKKQWEEIKKLRSKMKPKMT